MTKEEALYILSTTNPGSSQEKLALVKQAIAVLAGSFAIPPQPE
jgi:hypothetical protein